MQKSLTRNFNRMQKNVKRNLTRMRIIEKEKKAVPSKATKNIKKEILGSEKTLEKIKFTDEKLRQTAKSARLEKYLETGSPALLAKLKEEIINEAIKESAEGPTNKKLSLLNKRFNEAGFEKKLKEAEENLTQLMRQGDPILKGKAIRAAGKLGLSSVVKMAANDADPLIRREAGVTAAGSGMKDIARKIMKDPREVYSVKLAVENGIRASEGKIILRDIYPKTVMSPDKTSRDVYGQIKKEEKDRKERENK